MSPFCLLHYFSKGECSQCRVEPVYSHKSTTINTPTKRPDALYGELTFAAFVVTVGEADEEPVAAVNSEERAPDPDANALDPDVRALEPAVSALEPAATRLEARALDPDARALDPAPRRLDPPPNRLDAAAPPLTVGAAPGR
jgi:hypothetical protein